MVATHESDHDDLGYGGQAAETMAAASKERACRPDDKSKIRRKMPRGHATRRPASRRACGGVPVAHPRHRWSGGFFAVSSIELSHGA